MEITINNKVYIGKHNKEGRLIISLSNADDVTFFQQWKSQLKDIMLKKDYVKDFDYIIWFANDAYDKGILRNCQPILSENMDYVELLYDFKQGGLILQCS